VHAAAAEDVETVGSALETEGDAVVEVDGEAEVETVEADRLAGH
jgi:hypothetical protein